MADLTLKMSKREAEGLLKTLPDKEAKTTKSAQAAMFRLREAIFAAFPDLRSLWM